MKISKRAKKYVNKLYKNTKESIQAQLFYAKQGLSQAVHFIKLFAISILFIASTILSVFVADKAHKSYLEHTVGSQVLFVKSMPDSKRQGSATGFHVKTQRGNVVFVTNAHVCELANDKGLINIEDKLNSKRLIPRRVLEVYKDNDLCAVEPLPGYEGLTLADDLDVGDTVWAIGYPLGESLNITSGRIKDFGTTTLMSEIPLDKCDGPRLKKETFQMWIFIVQVCTVTLESVQTDVIIFGGNSGSPLLNMFGNVTGVVFASNTRTNWGRAVPLDHLKTLLKAY